MFTRFVRHASLLGCLLQGSICYIAVCVWGSSSRGLHCDPQHSTALHMACINLFHIIRFRTQDIAHANRNMGGAHAARPARTMQRILSCTLCFSTSACVYDALRSLLDRPQSEQGRVMLVADDLQEVLDPMQPSGMQLPVFMGGQSMGGMLTILTALRDQSAWQVHDFLPALLTSDSNELPSCTRTTQADTQQVFALSTSETGPLRC